MIVFQVKGQSHRLSTLKGKENFFSTYSTKYNEDIEALGRQLSQAKSKPDRVDRVRTAHYIDVHIMCTIMMHNSTELVKKSPRLPSRQSPQLRCCLLEGRGNLIAGSNTTRCGMGRYSW